MSVASTRTMAFLVIGLMFILGLLVPHARAQDDLLTAELARNRGVIAFSRGEYDAALEPLRQAPPSDAISQQYRALCLMELQRYEEAADLLELLVANPAAPAEAELDLGVAQLSAGNNQDALLTLMSYYEKYPDDAYGRYYLGVVALRFGDRATATAILDSVRDDTELAPYVDHYRTQQQQQQIAAPTPPPRNWNFTLITGYEYDSNVTLSPSFTGLGAGRDIEASSWIVALFSDYRLVERECWNVGLIGSAFGSFHYQSDQFAAFDGNDFDAQDYMGGAYTNYLLTDHVFAGVRYEFHETLLQGQQFSYEHRLVPNITLLEGDFGHTTFFYEFDSAEFDATPLIPALDPSGDVHRVGVTQAIYTFGDEGRLFAGYFYDSADARGSDFDRQTHQVNGRVEMPVYSDIIALIADAGFRYFWDSYENPNSLDFFGQVREDERSELRAGLQLVLSPHVSFRVDYTYVNSVSNVANLFDVRFYDFTRHIVTSQFIYDF